MTNLDRAAEKLTRGPMFEKLYAIRYDMLSAFVALDLLNQAKQQRVVNDNSVSDLLNQIIEAIDKIDPASVEVFAEIIGQDLAVSNPLEQRLRELADNAKETVTNIEKQKDFHKNLEDFAVYLEKITTKFEKRP